MPVRDCVGTVSRFSRVCSPAMGRQRQVHTKEIAEMIAELTTLKTKVEKSLDTVRPALRADGGVKRQLEMDIGDN